MMFSTSELVVWDGLRILAALAAMVVIGTTPFALVRNMSWHQRLRFISSCLVGVPIVGAYLQSLGTVPAQWWRVLLITAGMLAAAIGWVAYVYTTTSTSRHRR